MRKPETRTGRYHWFQKEEGSDSNGSGGEARECIQGTLSQAARMAAAAAHLADALDAARRLLRQVKVHEQVLRAKMQGSGNAWGVQHSTARTAQHARHSTGTAQGTGDWLPEPSTCRYKKGRPLLAPRSRWQPPPARWPPAAAARCTALASLQAGVGRGTWWVPAIKEGRVAAAGTARRARKATFCACRRPPLPHRTPAAETGQ